MLMEIDLDKDEKQKGSNIKAIGVGGAGGNAINTMIDYGLDDVEFIIFNTDIKDIKKSKAKVRLQIGKQLTRGLGTGSDPQKGKKAAEESFEEIRGILEGSAMIFLAAGMGGGTGTGASPVIASLAKEMGILVIGIVNRPFNFEGSKRMNNAQNGILELKKNVDTLIVIPNEKLKDEFPDMTMMNAFKKADEVLYNATKAVADIIHKSGYINVDFADVKTVTENKGYALIGIGEAEGEDKAEKAAIAAMDNPLLSDVSLNNAEGILINITAGDDFKADEYQKIHKLIIDQAGNDGELIPGLVNDPDYQNKVKVTLIATGLNIEDEKEYIIGTLKNDIDTEEDIRSVLKRVRGSNEMGLKKKNENKNKVNKPKMEVPAFLRKFSN